MKYSSIPALDMQLYWALLFTAGQHYQLLFTVPITLYIFEY